MRIQPNTETQTGTTERSGAGRKETGHAEQQAETADDAGDALHAGRAGTQMNIRERERRVVSVAAHCCPPARIAACFCSGTRCEIRRSILAELQGADIGRDAPAVVHRHARCIAVHGAVTICHNVEKVSYRGIHQALVVIAGRLAQTAAHDHAVAIAQPAVTRRAVDVKSLLPALDIGAA